MYIYIYTHTHTHTYIYIYISIYTCIWAIISICLSILVRISILLQPNAKSFCITPKILLLRIFHITISWWFFTGVWVTASFLMSPELFSVFWVVVYWPSTQPNMPFQRQRKCHIPMTSYGKKSHRRAWLTIWDKVKSRSRVTDWCTGREWPVNWMTVIFAWWQSKMPFQRQWKWHIPMGSYGEILSGRLNYYITWWRQEVSEFGDQTCWWQDAVEEASTQQSGPPGTLVEQPRGMGKNRGYGQ